MCDTIISPLLPPQQSNPHTAEPAKVYVAFFRINRYNNRLIKAAAPDFPDMRLLLAVGVLQGYDLPRFGGLPDRIQHPA